MSILMEADDSKGFCSRPPVWRMLLLVGLGILLAWFADKYVKSKRPAELPDHIAKAGLGLVSEVVQVIETSDFAQSPRGSKLTDHAKQMLSKGRIHFSPNMDNEALYRKEFGRSAVLYISVFYKRGKVIWPSLEELAERIYHESLHDVLDSKSKSREEECDAFCAAEEAAAAVSGRSPAYPVTRDGMPVWDWVKKNYKNSPSDSSYVPLVYTLKELSVKSGMKQEMKVISGNKSTAPVLPHKTAKSVHVIVALCDNKTQGIVPVSSTLGNGDDPHNNLYWGAMYGTKSFLKRSKSWTLKSQVKDVSADHMERVVFKHARRNVYIVADAYRGSSMKKAVLTFLRAAGGNDASTLTEGGAVIGIYGCADLLVFVGHNGLMDFTLPEQKRMKNSGSRDAMVLACRSEPYFHPRLKALGCKSLLLTAGLMAPEAYTVDAAVCAWAEGSSNATIRERAAAAYNKYQKCGMNGARRLFYTEIE